MGKCSNCGAEAKDNAKFCKACGVNLSGDSASLHDKKARVMNREQQWKIPLAVAAVIVLAVAALWLAKSGSMSKKIGAHPMFPPHRDASARLANAMTVNDRGGDVSIPLKALNDGKAHFFAYASGGKTVTFFVMKARDGSIHTAFDACMACNHAKLGYRQEGDLVVCNNCGMGFKPTEIGMVTGGCNPIPVNKSVNGQMVVLKAKDLDAGVQYF
ncbi:MAG: Fe-S-containing protein [Betaproteobacteria bacterium]